MRARAAPLSHAKSLHMPWASSLFAYPNKPAGRECSCCHFSRSTILNLRLWRTEQASLSLGIFPKETPQRLQRPYNETANRLQRDYEETTERLQRLQRDYKETAKRFQRDCKEIAKRLERDYKETTKRLQRDYEEYKETTRRLQRDCKEILKLSSNL